MARTPLTAIRIPAEIKAAAEAWCQKNGMSLSRLVLIGILREIGRLDLLDAAPPLGRPAGVPSKPVPKKRRR
jgi:hypothetical protein